MVGSLGNNRSCQDDYMTLDKEFYINHIQGEDYIFKMRKILDNVEMVLNNYRQETTDFLDPYERYLARSILNRFDEIIYNEDGGLDESERKVINIFPFYLGEDDIEEKISFLKIQYPEANLSHKDLLGAILNLGIIREKIGDIYVHNDKSFIIVKKEIKDFLLYNLNKVSNYNVKNQDIKRSEIKVFQEDYKEVKKIVSSLRLDTIISSIYNMSRQNSLKIIKSDRIKINFKPVNKPAIELNEGDLISAKGYGRSKFYSINGISKKGNYNITFRILM